MIFLFFISSSLLCLFFHLLFHLLFSSLLFSSLFFFLSLSFFFFLPSVTMGHTQRRNSNTCQEPGPTEMSDGMRSTNICQKPFILSCLVLSSLSSSLFFLCLLSQSVSVCGVVCAVWCGTLKNPVCRFKTPRCVHSKTSPCMQAQHAHMLFSMWAWCWHTRGRFECTHGKRFESRHGGHRQFCLPRTAHVGLSLGAKFTESNHWMLPMFKFEKRSRTTCSRFLQSFALPDKTVKQQLLWGNVGGNQP